jgi:hypothetical protein
VRALVGRRDGEKTLVFYCGPEGIKARVVELMSEDTYADVDLHCETFEL